MSSNFDNYKLKVKTNLKYKNYLSAQAAYNRLSLLDSSFCNDFLANCCNCCGQCDCCPCLAGFLITIQGWEDGDCDCQRMNFIDLFVPYDQRIKKEFYACYKYGSVSVPTTLAISDCVVVPIVTWELYCDLGKRYLTITEQDGPDSRYKRLAGIVESLHQRSKSEGSESESETGDVTKLVRTVEVADCDTMEMSEGPPDICVVNNTSNGIPACSNCPSVLISAIPVFGGEYAESACHCCRPDRCESYEEGCSNPYPETLSMRVNDNCNGVIDLTLERSEGLCWFGTYETLCEECPGDNNNMLYIVEVLLCCINDFWTVSFTVISPDSCSPFGYTTNPQDAVDDIKLMHVDSCDPMNFSSLQSNCSTCEWRSCPNPNTIGSYCVLNFFISEDGSYL